MCQRFECVSQQSSAWWAYRSKSAGTNTHTHTHTRTYEGHLLRNLSHVIKVKWAAITMSLSLKHHHSSALSPGILISLTHFGRSVTIPTHPFTNNTLHLRIFVVSATYQTKFLHLFVLDLVSNYMLTPLRVPWLYVSLMCSISTWFFSFMDLWNVTGNK